ncbi:MAG: hypothetical protein GJT30_18535 [Geobacter sp.]|nr:hypothetical protein [Geobacter sp.]
MEIMGGFMVMFSVLAFFLTVVWFVFPFVVFAMKGKLDRAYLKLEDMEQRLANIEARLDVLCPLDRSETPPPPADPPEASAP